MLTCFYDPVYCHITPWLNPHPQSNGLADLGLPKSNKKTIKDIKLIKLAINKAKGD